MHRFITSSRFLYLALLLAMTPPGIAVAADLASSGFGKIVVPDPVKPAAAERCVEPVEVMRRDHMNFLKHQRDVTVFDGERDGKYSLVGCMDCHNPSIPDEEIVRYEDPQHFCADCHRYASVKIDCFECHADRGLANSLQGRLDLKPGSRQLSMHTLQYKLRESRGD